jgi:hypothetical protein
MNIQKDLSNLEAFRHEDTKEDTKIPPEEEICSRLFKWRNEKEQSIEDVFPFMQNISEAAQNRFRLYLIYLLTPIMGVEDCKKIMFRIVKYRSVKEVIGL